MTEKIKELKNLTVSRSAKLGICMRKMNETQVLFDGHLSVEVIIQRIAALKCYECIKIGACIRSSFDDPERERDRSH